MEASNFFFLKRTPISEEEKLKNTEYNGAFMELQTLS